MAIQAKEKEVELANEKWKTEKWKHDHEFTMSLMQNYKEMKNEMGYRDEVIISMMPKLKDLVDQMAATSNNRN